MSKMKVNRRGDGTVESYYLYTADDERLNTLDFSVSPVEETWTVRDLDGKVLRTWENVGGFNGTWTHARDHIYRDGALLASWAPSEDIRHFHVDHLRTPRLVTNANGRRVDGGTYFPFGEQADGGNPDEAMRFTGHERDLNGTGSLDDLDYMHARYCNPMTGRFLSVDPVGGKPHQPQSWNRYAYALGNPMRFVDPSGATAQLFIDEESKTIKITAQIDIWGEEATDVIAQEIESSIEEHWSGQIYTDPETNEQYSIEVDVSVKNVGSKKKAASAENRIQITSDMKDGRDFVNTLGRVDSGKWKPSSHPAVRAHEFGHLLGLGDDYSRRTGDPRSGHSGHLMAGGGPYSSWKIVQHEVNDVVAGPFTKSRKKGKNGITIP